MERPMPRNKKSTIADHLNLYMVKINVEMSCGPRRFNQMIAIVTAGSAHLALKRLVADDGCWRIATTADVTKLGETPWAYREERGLFLITMKEAHQNA